MQTPILTWLLNQGPAIVVLAIVAWQLLKRFDHADSERAELMQENAALKQQLTDIQETSDRHNTELQNLRSQLARCLENQAAVIKR